MARPLILIRGGGDLASGVGVRLNRCGFAVAVLEIPQPLAVRRLVAFAEAVYAGEIDVEGVRGRKAEDLGAARRILGEGDVPILVDPGAGTRHQLNPDAIVDGRMLKQNVGSQMVTAPLIVGLGPGFEVGVNCHAVVETNRGHRMGRVFWEGRAQRDTGVPEPVAGYAVERVLRAPASGLIISRVALGTVVAQGEVIAEVGGVPLEAAFEGALRGLMHDGLSVEEGEKIGDLDPRGVVEYCYQVSDKALAVGGGVLEALLSQASIRAALGT
jgi:xanthine dehydrogenase accessory factor